MTQFIRRFNFIFLILVLVLISFCDSSEQNPKKKDQQGIFPYDIQYPAERFILPAQLREISGLAYYKNNLLCIQDESADIYYFSPDKREITRTIHISRKGDFEDIAVIEDTAYLLKSNGKVLKVENFTGEYLEIEEYDSPLRAENDTEGIAFDNTSNSLLVACKGYPDISEKNRYKGSKTVYRIELPGMIFDYVPVIAINLKDPECFADSSVYARLRNSAARIPALDGFQPSALTFKPSTGEIYMISSSGNLILILNSGGKIATFAILPMNIFIQPEGICFSPSGDLYISNEGRGGNGYILRFTPR